MNTSSSKLTRQYVLALSILAMLSITAFFILRTAIKAQEADAAVVNVAGRQRMLSQRISRYALLLVLNKGSDTQETIRDTLAGDVKLFEASHKALVNGGSVVGISANETFTLPGNPTAEVQKMYFQAPIQLDQQVITYVAEANALLNDPDNELTLKNSHLQYLLTASATDILTALNTVTGQYQKESETAIARLERLEAGVLGITVLVLLLEAQLIFRPIVRQIVRNLELEENARQRELQNLKLETHAKTIALTTEVSQRLSIATDPQRLAVEVVEQVQAAFDYYHAHIYFVDETSGDLIMAGGTGDAGATMLARGHKIPHGRGLVGRAAATNAPVLVPDVSKAEGWLPNPLLPETKSEAAIPISSGIQVLGVLDVQQNTVNGLDQEDVRLLQSLAKQVAISLRNARLYEQSKSQAELETLANNIGEKIQRAATVEDTLKTAIRELGNALGASRVHANIGTSRQTDGNIPSHN